MAVRLYSKADVERILIGHDCHHVKDYATAAMWATSRGFHFIVPQEGDDRRTNEYTLGDILREIKDR